VELSIGTYVGLMGLIPTRKNSAVSVPLENNSEEIAEKARLSYTNTSRSYQTKPGPVISADASGAEN